MNVISFFVKTKFLLLHCSSRMNMYVHVNMYKKDSNYTGKLIDRTIELGKKISSVR